MVIVLYLNVFFQFFMYIGYVSVALLCIVQANTHNIELSESCPGDLAMDCVELTLLSRVRHHEELQEYNAPSQLPTPKLVSKIFYLFQETYLFVNYFFECVAQLSRLRSGVCNPDCCSS